MDSSRFVQCLKAVPFPQEHRFMFTPDVTITHSAYLVGNGEKAAAAWSSSLISSVEIRMLPFTSWWRGASLGAGMTFLLLHREAEVDVENQLVKAELTQTLHILPRVCLSYSERRCRLSLQQVLFALPVSWKTFIGVFVSAKQIEPYMSWNFQGDRTEWRFLGKTAVSGDL